jgi:hypothetical protein
VVTSKPVVDVKPVVALLPHPARTATTIVARHAPKEESSPPSLPMDPPTSHGHPAARDSSSSVKRILIAEPAIGTMCAVRVPGNARDFAGFAVEIGAGNRHVRCYP